MFQFSQNKKEKLIFYIKTFKKLLRKIGFEKLLLAIKLLY